MSVLPGESAVLHQRMVVADPALWSPDAPRLHHAEVTVRAGEGVLDRAHTSFGIRTLQLDAEHGLRINGNPVKLRGACIHHDNGILGPVTRASRWPSRSSSAEEVELLVNGESAGRRPAGAAHRYRAEFDAVFRPGSVVAVAYQGGHETGRTGLRTASPEIQVDARADRPVIAADSDDLAFIEIRLADEHDLVHTSADQRVTESIEGPAVLQGLGAADPRDQESFADATHRTFRGRALAAVRPTGPGRISVTVTDERGMHALAVVTAQ